MQSSYQMAFGSSGAGQKKASNGASFPSSGIDWGMGSAKPEQKTDQPSFGYGFGSSIGGLGGISGVSVQETGEYEPNASSVKEYAYDEDKNFRFRPAMEDTHCIVDKLGGDQTCGMFAVFDGHGGRQVSDHCAERFPPEMRKEMMKSPTDLCQSLISVFAKIDNELRLLDSDGCGSTACVGIVRKEGAHSILYMANIGDTRAVLSKSGQAERLSIDHKCDNTDEVARIKSNGGLILDQRVGGVLAVTRAFGDHSLRKAGLTAVPHVLKYALKPFDKYLVIASDGVWDELSDQDAINYCKDDVSTKHIAQAIVKAAIAKGSKDNTSVIVVRFNSTTSQVF